MKKEENKAFSEIMQTVKSLFKEAKNNKVIVKDKNKKVFDLSFLIIIIITLFFPIVTVIAILFVLMSNYKISMEKK